MQFRQRLDDADSIAVQVQLFEGDELLEGSYVGNLIERQIQLEQGGAFGDAIKVFDEVVRRVEAF